MRPTIIYEDPGRVRVVMQAHSERSGQYQLAMETSHCTDAMGTRVWWRRLDATIRPNHADKLCLHWDEPYSQSNEYHVMLAEHLLLRLAKDAIERYQSDAA